MASLDRSMSALRVLSVGGDVGPRLSSVAAATGGFAVDVGTGPVAALRAVDVLTTTFTDQYRVTATVAEPGDQLVRLTVAGRRYETVVPDLGASAVPPTTTSTSTSTTSTTTTPPTTTLAARRSAGAALGRRAHRRRKATTGHLSGRRRPGRRRRRRHRAVVVAAAPTPAAARR